MTNKKEIYVCMSCSKTYEENPVLCKGKTGRTHSRFSENYCGISNKIFKFRLGHTDESLEKIPHFARQGPERPLKKAGFDVIEEFRHRDGEIKDFVKLLNKSEIEYVLFSVTCYPGTTTYTFMEKT